MTIREIVPNTYYVGALDWDRRLFDELIPLPNGTTYNSYLIKGSEKTALLDTVDPTKENALIENLRELNVEKIDYIIAHHAEQDHSGSLPKILKLYPMSKVVTNGKCKDLLQELLSLTDDKFILIKDRETISLGDKTLEFILAPWVHWPETMFTYAREDKILFTCDFLGSHLAQNELFANEDPKVYLASKRYYAEIMMPYRTSVKSNLDKIKGLEIKMAAPSHGPIYNKPEFMTKAYSEWASPEMKNEVVIAYVSMHGSTQAMVDYFVSSLTKNGIEVKLFNLPKTDIGELAMALVDAATIVVGSPTVIAGLHPAAVYAACLVNLLRPKAAYASMIGSFGWSSKIVEQLTSMMPFLKVEFLKPVIAKGYPKKPDFEALDRLASEIYENHKSNKLVKKAL